MCGGRFHCLTVLCGRLLGSPLCVHVVFTVETNYVQCMCGKFDSVTVVAGFTVVTVVAGFMV